MPQRHRRALRFICCVEVEHLPVAVPDQVMLLGYRLQHLLRPAEIVGSVNALPSRRPADNDRQAERQRQRAEKRVQAFVPRLVSLTPGRRTAQHQHRVKQPAAQPMGGHRCRRISVHRGVSWAVWHREAAILKACGVSILMES